MVKLRVEEVAWQKHKRLSQLAQESGVPVATVSDYWHNRMKYISIPTVTKIALALGVRFNDLIDDTDTVPQESKAEVKRKKEKSVA